MKRIAGALAATDDLRAALSVTLPLSGREWLDLVDAVRAALGAARLYCPVCGRPVPPSEVLVSTDKVHRPSLINCYECFEVQSADAARKAGR